MIDETFISYVEPIIAPMISADELRRRTLDWSATTIGKANAGGEDLPYSVGVMREDSLNKLAEALQKSTYADVVVFWDVFCDMATYDQFMADNGSNPHYGVVDGIACYSIGRSQISYAAIHEAAKYMMFQDFVVAAYSGTRSPRRDSDADLYAITAFDGEGFIVLKPIVE